MSLQFAAVKFCYQLIMYKLRSKLFFEDADINHFPKVVFIGHSLNVPTLFFFNRLASAGLVVKIKN